ncbi:von Willebrand factor C domain-containing protein 2-like [Scleropages formosus]|uniref:Si:dkey-283b1.7 n=1 Tax=Scleropages formosus TaxID=113540 RepID=A0A0N8K214_SCLFO|nr:brorin-like [Scleropages formosus]KPP76465.1 von Willebrand factor C domain-containing protein 2-like [Scleropages formosus]
MSACGAPLALALAALATVACAEYSSRSDAEYDFGDYRGRWCLDHLGFVYSIGDVYYPSAVRCPCTCTADGPVCARPRCPRIHPRCTRVTYRSCCPVCEAFSRVCVHKGKTYKVLEEFWLSPCEKCRCGYNMEVYCTVAECPGLHCVNPTYVPHQCCPICKTGPNCFVGNTVIPAGVRVQVDEHQVCYCSYKEGTWEMHHQATCEVQERRSGSGATPEQTERQLEPRLETIP